MLLRRAAALTFLVAVTLMPGTPLRAVSANDTARRTVDVNLGFGQVLMTVTFSEDGSDPPPQALTLDPAAMLFGLADQRGTKVVLAPLESGPVTSRSDGAVLTYRMPQDLPAGMYALSYQGPDSVREVSGTTADIVHIPDQPVYFPDDDEKAFQAIRSRLIGNRVYGYPNVAIDCPGRGQQLQNRVATANSARIVDVVRYTHLTLPVYYNSRRATDVANTPDFIAVNPIIVTFDELEPGGALPAHQRAGTVPCSEAIRVFADAWQIDRELTLRTANDHDEWPAAMLAAIASGQPTIGMTPEMVAFAWGFPPQLGTVADLEKLDVWTYGTGPAAARVRFENGRVIDVTIGEVRSSTDNLRRSGPGLACARHIRRRGTPM
jgi:hypothetical protein